MGNLFGKNVEELKFGVAPGSHVAHILKDNENGTELFTKEPRQLESGYEQVSQEEIYSNASEQQTKDFFMSLAARADRDYDREDIVPEMKTLMTHLRDYVTASGRREQQLALKAFQTRSERIELELKNKAAGLYQNRDSLSEEQKAELKLFYNSLKAINEYKESFAPMLSGNLPVGWHETKIDEPADVTIGRFHSWKKTDDVLFPHVPSPNDVKQGVGVFDCYVLAALSRIAATDPQKIMDMMKDNGDGTVSVQFYAKDYEKNNPQPVIVTVNKTVNQDAFGNNSYASGSLWVQMFEKAYAKYNELYVAPRCFEKAEETRKEMEKARQDQEKYKDWAKETDKKLRDSMKQAYDDAVDKEDTCKDDIPCYQAEGEKKAGGMNSIWVGYSNEVLDAIYPEHFEQVPVPNPGPDFYKQDPDGNFINHPSCYLAEERKFYEILDEHINRRHETITAIPERLKEMKKAGESKDAGLHPGHIYAINKVFEKGGKKFVQLRDPYAMFSAKYENGKLVSDSHELKGTYSGGLDNMGTFNLELKDFFRHFQNLTSITQEMVKTALPLSTNEARNYSDRGYPLTEYEKTHELPLHLEARKYIDDYDKWKLKMANPKIPAKDKPKKPVFDAKGIQLDEKIAKELYRSLKILNNPELTVIFEEAFGRKPAAEKQKENQPLAAEVQPKAPAEPEGSVRAEVPAEKVEEPVDEMEMPQAVDSREVLERVVPSETDKQLLDEAVANQKEYEDTSKDLWEQIKTDRLKSPTELAKLSAQLKEAAGDLKSTDEFFVFTNTAEFNAMRDTLYSVSRDVTTLAQGKLADADTARKQIAEKLNLLQQQSEAYLDKKQKSVDDSIRQGKLPSDRAMLRLTAAMSISGICNMESPLSPWPGKRAEQMKVVENDVQTGLQHPEKFSVDAYKRLQGVARSFEERRKLSSPAAARKEPSAKTNLFI